MKRLLFTAAMLLFAVAGMAQSTRLVRGFVQKSDGCAIVGATITVVDEPIKATSTAGGAFELRVSPYARFVDVTHEGYIPCRLEIDGSLLIARLQVDTRSVKSEEASAVNKDTAPAAAPTAKESAPKDIPAKDIPAKEVVSKEDAAKAKRAERMVKCIASNVSKGKGLAIETPKKSYTELGLNYYYGKGVAFDVERAFLCFNLGAQKDEPESFYWIGTYYETGRSFNTLYVEANRTLALAFYERAAELGVAEAKSAVERLKKK